MPATVAPAAAQPGDLIALVCTDTFAGTYELAPEPVADTAPSDVIPARVSRIVIAQDGATLVEVDWMRDEAAGRIGRTARTFRTDAAPVCEHRVPMDAPCRPCAIAGHEPVDLDDDETDEDVDTTIARVLAAHPRVARTVAREEARAAHETAARARLDSTRHLADCRGCALAEPDGHAYASLIDVPITVAELVTVAARTDLSAATRAGAAEALVHELAGLAGRPEPTDVDHAEAARLIAAA